MISVHHKLNHDPVLAGNVVDMCYIFIPESLTCMKIKSRCSFQSEQSGWLCKLTFVQHTDPLVCKSRARWYAVALLPQFSALVWLTACRFNLCRKMLYTSNIKRVIFIFIACLLAHSPALFYYGVKRRSRFLIRSQVCWILSAVQFRFQNQQCCYRLEHGIHCLRLGCGLSQCFLSCWLVACSLWMGFTLGVCDC